MSVVPYPDCYREPLLPDTIRLLRLLPSEDEAGPIQCKLFHYPLQEINNRTHPYEALSYVWGDPDKSQYISIVQHNSRGEQCSTSENDLRVTENLHAALLRLRYRTFERIIWIDAVCINQNNEREKEQQIQFMAKIYALANRVLVWLGGAAKDSNRAIDWIRVAGANKTKVPPISEAVQQAVIALLQRPWFRRIWVLQEVAAARNILITCGPTEIDGYAFCLGVDLFEGFPNARADLQSLAHSVTYLIKGAIFRPQYSLSRPGRFSLDIRPLGELINMYHAHEATKYHDRVFALLGMSTDDLGQAKLLPDYSVQWKVLLQRLIQYLLCEDISVEVRGVDQELAVIEGKGCVLGKISSSEFEHRWNQEQGLHSKLRNRCASFGLSQPSAKPVQEGDLIYLLRGASYPTIIRQRQDHFEIIAIHTDLRSLSQSNLEFTHDLILTWDWGFPSEKLQYWERYNQVLDFSQDFGGCLEKMTRLGNVARVLMHAERYDEAQIRLREAYQIYETTFGKPYTAKAVQGFTPLSWAAENGHDAAVRLLVAENSVDLDLKGRRPDRTPLSWAAGKGHVTVVKLLLETGEVEINSEDESGRTPLSWAAEKGHHNVVKLLLEASRVEINSKDESGRTPFSWAAENGHQSVVKLLLETGRVKLSSRIKMTKHYS